MLAGGRTCRAVTPGAAEGSASDEAEAARGGSAADDEPAIVHGTITVLAPGLVIVITPAQMQLHVEVLFRAG
jgi:hypothetical protein